VAQQQRPSARLIRGVFSSCGSGLRALTYARMLIQAEVPTEVHHYTGAFHLAHVIPGPRIGARMVGDRIKPIRRALGG
jgi:hypothetical protein